MAIQIHNKKKVKKPDEVRATLALQIVNRYMYWIVLLLVGIVLFLGYIFVIGEQLDRVRNVAQENLKIKEKMLSDLKVIKNELDGIVLKFDTIKKSKEDILERLDELLPNESLHGDLFTIVDELTTRMGLTMSSINFSLTEKAPDRVRPEFEAVDVESAGQRVAVTTADVKSMSISLSVSGGTYESFKNYLDALERNLRLFDVKTLSFDGAPFRATEDGVTGIPSYTIELVTYYQPT